MGIKSLRQVKIDVKRAGWFLCKCLTMKSNYMVMHNMKCLFRIQRTDRGVYVVNAIVDTGSKMYAKNFADAYGYRFSN